MKYLLIGFMMSIGWYLGKILVSETTNKIHQKLKPKHHTISSDVNYRLYK